MLYKYRIDFSYFKSGKLPIQYGPIRTWNTSRRFFKLASNR